MVAQRPLDDESGPDLMRYMAIPRKSPPEQHRGAGQPTDRQGLGQVYEEIDALETTAIEVENFTSYGELFYYPLAAGLLLLLLEVGLVQSVLRTLP